MSMPAQTISPLAALPLMLVALVVADPRRPAVPPVSWLGRRARRLRRAARSVSRRRPA